MFYVTKLSRAKVPADSRVIARSTYSGRHAIAAGK